MDEKKKEVRYDLDGGKKLTAAILETVNQYPPPQEGWSVAFATLGEREGLALFPGGDSVIKSERRSVTGKVRQDCRYPF